MKLVFTKPFIKAYRKLPQEIQQAFKNKLSFFIDDPSHPSLRIKKIQGVKNLWEGRITINYRFTFSKHKDFLLFRAIGKHDILDKQN
jgi:mRNA-degrading endonuclease RelE of RelBE toxin-antitoxin system